MFGCLTVPEVRPHHTLAARASFHLARVAVHVAVAAAHGPVPLGPGAGGGAAGGRVLGAVGAAAVVGELHPLAAVLDHEVAEVDVGPPVVAAHHVWRLVAVVLAVGQTGVVLTVRPVNLQSNIKVEIGACYRMKLLNNLLF